MEQIVSQDPFYKFGKWSKSMVAICRGGIFTMVKSIIEAISLYWHSFAYISK
jgi:hypothetical protein